MMMITIDKLQTVLDTVLMKCEIEGLTSQYRKDSLHGSHEVVTPTLNLFVYGQLIQQLFGFVANLCYAEWT